MTSFNPQPWSDAALVVYARAARAAFPDTTVTVSVGDLGSRAGLAVVLPDGRRYTTPVTPGEPPDAVVARLRAHFAS